jgi:hypothetical protein
MLASLILVFFAALQVAAQSNFTIINGQIYTPGLAIVDAPQPFTPEGGGMYSSPILIDPTDMA